MLKDTVDHWKAQWCLPEGDPRIHELLVNLKALREYTHTNEPPPKGKQCVHHKFVESIKKYKKDTKGADAWTNTELKALPEVATYELASALDLSIHNLAQPIQNMLSLNACLGKPSGHRTVCKTPMLYRHLNRARSMVSQWEV